MKVLKTMSLDIDVALYLSKKENFSKYIQELIKVEMEKEKGVKNE